MVRNGCESVEAGKRRVENGDEWRQELLVTLKPDGKQTRCNAAGTGTRSQSNAMLGTDPTATGPTGI